jgi:hypothetical protein
MDVAAARPVARALDAADPPPEVLLERVPEAYGGVSRGFLLLNHGDVIVSVLSAGIIRLLGNVVVKCA